MTRRSGLLEGRLEEVFLLNLRTDTHFQDFPAQNLKDVLRRINFFENC